MSWREDKRTQPVLRSPWPGEGTAAWCEGVSEGGAERGLEEGTQSCLPLLGQGCLDSVLVPC